MTGSMRLQVLTAGGWLLVTDPENVGREKRWYERVQPQAQEAPVPGIIQQVVPGYHGVAWYWLAFMPDMVPVGDEQVLLRFGAVDYLAEVWLNGKPVGGHEGGETPFTLDVTSSFKAGQKNFLAVRVLNPTDKPIDGIALKDTPHSQKGTSDCGADFNNGGIVLPVQLFVAPAVRITDIFAAPDIHSGEVRLSVTLRNDTREAVEGMLSLAISPDKTGEVAVDTQVSVSIAAGESTRDIVLTVRQPHLWSLDDPFLYRAQVALTTSSRHELSARFGFREFRVVGGYFHLNDRRIFLRSMHTAPFYPVVQLGAPDPDFMRRDMVYAKACGFNCVRFISKMPLPEQLDIADEIGIMVYAESYAAWWHFGALNQKVAAVKNPEMVKQRFASAIREMILRDRNHPSLTIWGLLNEVPAGLITEQAVAALPLIRSLDNTRLVLLHSGRWDERLDIGSLSNPGSNAWECQWGAEGKDVKPGIRWSTPGYFETAGDIHYYPGYPITPANCAKLRQMGGKARPVFLSEGGIGSALNAVAELKKYEEKPELSANLEDRIFFRKIVAAFDADWKRFGLKDVYPFAEDMLRESQRIHGSQRRRWFDMIRSNPNYCGHSMTSMLDGTSGEGIWSFWREFKPGIVDVMRDGWAPLRWCLFVSPLHGYAKRPIEIEAVLANEGVLKPGTYPVTFRIWGKEGVVWEKRIQMHLPVKGKSDMSPLAVPVLKTQVRLNVPEGDYVFAACLEQGGVPAGDRRPFHLSCAEQLPHVKGVVTLWGVEPKVQKWLERHGLRTQPAGKSASARQVILVGRPKDTGLKSRWEWLMRRLAEGAYVIFLEPEAIGGTRWLPLKEKGNWIRVSDWLYHKEAVAKNHPLFAGLPAPGILDWDFYDEVAGRQMLLGGDTPDTAIAVGIAVGLSQLGGFDSGAWWGGGSRSYNSGVLVGEYRFGKGCFVLNGLPLLSNIDRHPAADRLLLNSIIHGLNKGKVGPARATGGVEEYFKTLPFAGARLIEPRADGTMLLGPRDCELQSPKIGEPERLSNHGTDRIGTWTALKARAIWQVRAKAAGRFRVVIEQACDSSMSGSRYTLRIGKTRLNGIVQPSKGWFDYVEVDLGEVSLPAGTTQIDLAVTSFKTPNIFMDVKTVRLISVTGHDRRINNM